MAFRFKSIFPLSVVLIAVTCWQYVYCGLQTPSGWHFLGLTCDGRDSLTYLASLAQARAGHFFLSNLYTGEIEKPVYWNLFWWLLGAGARLTGLSSIAAFQVARVGGSLVLLLLLGAVIRDYLPTDRQRWTAFVLIALGTGAGWLLVVVWALSGRLIATADLTMPEGFAFLAMMWKPHMVFSMILQIAALCLFAASCSRRRAGWAVGAGLLTLMLGLAHGFHLVTVYTVVTVYGLLRAALDRGTERWRALCHALIVIALSAPAVFFLLWMVHSSALMAAWNRQNICLSPPVWFYLLGYAPQCLILLLFPRRLIALKDRAPHNLFLLTWLFCNAALLYTGGHIIFERRLAQGIQIPLTLLAVQLFFSLPAMQDQMQDARCPMLDQQPPPQSGGSPARQPLPRLVGPNTLLLIWIISALPTSLYNLLSTSFQALPPRSPGLYYISSDEAAAANYLRAHAAPLAVILAPETQSDWLPVVAGRHIFSGHPVQTVDYDRKAPLVRRFYAGRMSPNEIASFLPGCRIAFVWWPHATTGSYPARAFSTNVWNSAQVSLYQVHGRDLVAFDKMRSVAPSGGRR